MENIANEAVLPIVKGEKLQKAHKFRDTTPIRVDRSIKEAVKELSKRRHETMSQITDWALKEYLESVKSLD
ncbi:MAG: hypothetical protein NUV47_03425 [Patescibacteria group bacterium]|nr:hypothetical protein [Patescibacteria group bacterium]